ncbi:hypothetical protein FBZ33_0350 [Micromonospora sp. A202]|uniref:pyridoxamine 5-phosphate oxidase n=1 Tax=Micromonospora sp. A202 TaxID=2572899 RepID=UPI0011711011|nr:pyridoxamine 5-phosphate oxidase [Micromonospora sp. A202]TQJ20161.1 hypothetical protein FBZ33_0350 [Micromonospora sp. A202]
MASWMQVETADRSLADRVKRRFAMGTNKTIATLRKDGGPRISACEVEFRDSEVKLGMMPGSMKLLDLLRDARIAIHCPTIEPTEEQSDGWPGDAKLAGVAVEVPEPADNTVEGARFFRVDVREVVLTYVAETRDHLIVESWQEGRGVQRRPRY